MESDIAKAVRDARAAALLAFFCLLLLGVMLMIDGQRNRWLLGQIQEARQILNDFQAAARTVGSPAVNFYADDEPIEKIQADWDKGEPVVILPRADGKVDSDGAGTTVASDLGGAGDHDVHAGGDGAAGVGSAAGAGTRVDPPRRRAVPPKPAPSNGRAGMAGGPRGHG